MPTVLSTQVFTSKWNCKEEKEHNILNQLLGLGSAHAAGKPRQYDALDAHMTLELIWL